MLFYDEQYTKIEKYLEMMFLHKTKVINLWQVYVYGVPGVYAISSADKCTYFLNSKKFILDKYIRLGNPVQTILCKFCEYKHIRDVGLYMMVGVITVENKRMGTILIFEDVRSWCLVKGAMSAYILPTIEKEPCEFEEDVIFGLKEARIIRKPVCSK